MCVMDFFIYIPDWVLQSCLVEILFRLTPRRVDQKGHFIATTFPDEIKMQEAFVLLGSDGFMEVGMKYFAKHSRIRGIFC